MARTWTCQRQTGGVVCKHVNPKRRIICQSCGKKRPPTKHAAHMAALGDMNYERAVEIFGERCGICGVGPKPDKKLQRDHEHKESGFVRGLLCFQCNIMLKDRHTLSWMRRALAYLERSEERKTSCQKTEQSTP